MVSIYTGSFWKVFADEMAAVQVYYVENPFPAQQKFKLPKQPGLPARPEGLIPGFSRIKKCFFQDYFRPKTSVFQDFFIR